MGVIARKKTWLAVFVALLTVVAVSLASLPASMKTNFHSIAHADPKGIKYLGVGACGGNGCHSEDIKSPKPTDKPGHDESTIWEKNDGHARAFDDSIRKKKGITLKNKDAAKIAKAMKIADPTAEARCLACHALTGFSNGETKARIPLDFTKDVEAAQLAKGSFKPSNGVSCDACHGPSEKYLTPHQTVGWTQTQRAQGGAALYDTWGLYNTKDLNMRANLCVSCHLKIDPEMVKAGHPEPTFELDTMSHGKWMHWRPNGNYFGVKAWAMGQFVSVREAALQLAERVKGKADAELISGGYKQLAAHVLMARHAAQVVAPKLDEELNTQFAAATTGLADAAKAEAALHALGKAADGLAEELNKKTADAAMLDALAKGVAAEADAAGKVGFHAALQFSYAMTALSEAEIMKGEAPLADPDAMKAKLKGNAKADAASGVGDTVTDPSDFKDADFTAAAKKVQALYPGGAAIPLPAGGPK